MADFPIDDDTIIRKPFGQFGLPISPCGGIDLGPPLSIKPIIASGSVRGIPKVYIGGAQVGPERLSIFADVFKQDRICFTRFLMQLVPGEHWYGLDGTPLTGTLTVELPYELPSPEYVGGLAWFYNFGTNGFKRFIQRDSSTTIKFVTYQNVSATGTSPVVWGDLTLLLFNLSYIVDCGSPLLWEIYE